MKNKITILALLLTAFAFTSYGQYRDRGDKNITDPETKNYFKIGTQFPFQHSIIYDHRIAPGFSINGGLGLITGPYTNMIYSGLENKGMINSSDKAILGRTFDMGITYQLGANFHFSKNYVRVYGQMMNLRGGLAYTDLANLYLGTNIPDVARFLNPIQIRSNVPMAGALFGRRFSIGQNSEIHVEASVGKTLGHNTSYKTNTFLDRVNVVNEFLYTGVNNSLDNYFVRNGWLPSLNVYYVYKF